MENPNDGNVYLKHIRVLFSELEHLQLEFSRLRQRLVENEMLNNKHATDNKNNPSDKAQLYSLKKNNEYLEEELAKTKRLYCDLLESFNNCESKHSSSKLENENKELKENYEYIRNENAVLVESEQAHLNERQEWLKEKEEYEKVVVWSKDVNDRMKFYKKKLEEIQQVFDVEIESVDGFIHLLLEKCPEKHRFELSEALSLDRFSFKLEALKKLFTYPSIQFVNDENNQSQKDEILSLKLENEKLKKELIGKDETLEKLNQKYARNRQVYEANEKNSIEEIQKLDNLIEMIFKSLQSLPEDVKQLSDLQALEKLDKMKDRLSLSKNLLQMKFMQRTKESVEKQKREESSQIQLVDQELLDMCKKESDKFLTTNSFVFCENLNYGRMSFRGMNPEIEKIMEAKRMKPEGEENTKQEEEEKSADVSANDIVNMFHHKKRKHYHNNNNKRSK